MKKLKHIRLLTPQEAEELTDTEDMAVCPHCHEIIGFLDYRAEMVGWGNAELNGDHNEEKGNEFMERKFFCPECDKEVLPLKGAEASL